MAHKTLRQREAAIDDRLNGLGVCSIDMGGDAPAPDPLIGQAAQQNAEVGREYLQWYKAKDAAEAPYRQEAADIALDMARQQIATSQKQEGYADDTRAYELSTFRPLEKKIAADALGYDTAERRDSEASQAQADVGTAADAARGNMVRTVKSLGGDVNSGNFTAALAGTGVRETALQASAGNTARKNVETIGAAKLADAANLGRGIASTNATQTQLGLQAGNSGVNNAQVPGQSSNQQTAAYGGAAGTAIQGNSSAGNMMLGQYNAMNKGDDGGNAIMGAIGGIAGAYFGGPAGAAAGAKIGSSLGSSDKNAKKDRKDVKPEVSLAAVRRLPVQSWKYKRGAMADDGGKTHVGPMAQDVNLSLGDVAAPDGKRIDLISMNGHTINAVKALDKRLLRLEDAKRPEKTTARSRKRTA